MSFRLDFAVASSHILATKTNGIGEDALDSKVLENEWKVSHSCTERSTNSCPVSSHLGGSELRLPSIRSSSISRVAKNLIGSLSLSIFYGSFRSNALEMD